ncbi:MAG: Lon protease [Actinobacteria bacterium]|nr:Lon protease [Actinomycetota bacterium]
MRFSPLPRLVRYFLAFILVLSLFIPLPFAIVLPGPATDVLGPVVQVPSRFADKVPKPTGKLMLTTVSVSTPDAKVFGFEVLARWIQADGVVVPKSVIYEPDVDAEKVNKESLAEMDGSQGNAIAAAFNYLNQNEPDLVPYLRSGELNDQLVNFDLPNTGGPSGGLIFALGIIEKLDSAQLVNGRLIAGTGTINKKGDVGPIGGIEDKLIGAKRAGATLFIAPIDNCIDISHIPNGLQVVAVSTLAQAVTLLKKPAQEMAKLPPLSGCSRA